MKQLPHHKYFCVTEKILNNCDSDETQAKEALKVAKRDGVHGLAEFLERLLEKKIDPFKQIIDAHYVMAKTFSKNPDVYILDKDLSLALLNSKSSVNIENIHFRSHSFVLYFNLDYGDLGYPQIESAYKYICVYCKISNKDNTVSISICSVRQNKQNKSIEEDEVGSLENSTFSTVIIPKDQPFDFNYFDRCKSQVVKNYKKVGNEKFLKIMGGGEWDYEIKAKIYHLIIAMNLYLSHDDDLSIEAPEITQKEVDKVTNPKKKRRLEKKLSQSMPYSISYVGKRYAEKIKRSSIGDSVPTPRKYSFRVQGFFNTFWYGKRRDEDGKKIPGEYKKIKWIEPQIRNKHLPENPNGGRIYKVR